MKAELKYLYSPDADDLAGYVPDDPDRFGLLIQAMVGPAGEDSYESFDLIVCTSSWLAELASERGPTMGRHHLIVSGYDYKEIEAFIRVYCSNCEGLTWNDVGPLVGRLGHWEFEDYREYSPVNDGMMSWARASSCHSVAAFQCGNSTCEILRHDGIALMDVPGDSRGTLNGSLLV